eukprot:13279918-Ditylum_brightwellii.AAC.1
MNSLLQSQQSKRFSGAGAAHQNGIAERYIKIIVDTACILMTHAAIHSKEGTITVELWSMALDHAVWLFNRIPEMDSTYSPFGLFSSSKIWSYETMLVGFMPGAVQHMYWSQNYKNLALSIPNVRREQGWSFYGIQ